MSKEKTLYVISKTEGTRIIVQKTEFEGETYIQIVKQYKKKGDTEWSFTKNTVNIKESNLDKLIKTLKKFQ